MNINQLNHSAYKTEGVNRIQTMRFHPFVFTGKERDEETGYGYFGARYYDADLTTMWLSVDPMADKYPGISPYAYCAWNPVKLVDPDGRDVWKIDENGRLLSITQNSKYDCFIVCKENGKTIFSQKYQYGTIKRLNSYTRQSKSDGLISIDRYQISERHGGARDELMQFFCG